MNHYKANMTSGSLRLAESKIVAGLLLSGVDKKDWKDAIVTKNLLQAKSIKTAVEIARISRARLETMTPELWKLVRDGNGDTAIHAMFACAIKHCLLLGDFMRMVVADQYKLFAKSLAPSLWEKFIDECRGRDPKMTIWSDSTSIKMRSAVFHCLCQAGYIDNTKSKLLQTVHVAAPVLHYLRAQKEFDVIKSMVMQP
jgi:hypothetical protein